MADTAPSLHLHLTIGGTSLTRDVAPGTPTELAQAVHRHARGHLGSRAVNVDLNPKTLTGTVVQHGAQVGEFVLEPVELPATEPAPRQPMHGYTAADIDALARKAIAVDRWRSGDVEERLAAVRFAIVEHLCTSSEPPTRRELVQVGTHASDRHVVREMHHHGWNTDDIGAGSGAMVAYQRYWQTTPTPSPEGWIVDNLARTQIWPQLAPRQREALQALADTDDYQLAAAALGVAVGTFRVLISAGRRRYLEWWHEGETPSKTWRMDRRLHSRSGEWRGQRRLTVSEVDALRARYMAEGGPTLTALAAEAGVHKATLSELFRGRRSKPAPDPAPAGGAAA